MDLLMCLPSPPPPPVTRTASQVVWMIAPVLEILLPSVQTLARALSTTLPSRDRGRANPGGNLPRLAFNDPLQLAQHGRVLLGRLQVIWTVRRIEANGFHEDNALSIPGDLVGVP